MDSSASTTNFEHHHSTAALPRAASAGMRGSIDCEAQVTRACSGNAGLKLADGRRNGQYFGSGGEQRGSDEISAWSSSSSLHTARRWLNQAYSFCTADQPIDWSSTRLRFDAWKTATPTRCFVLTLLAEAGGVWLFSLGYHAAIYSALYAWLSLDKVDGIDATSAGLFEFFAFSLSLYFALIIFGPAGSGSQLVPQVSVAVTMLGLGPLWKLPFMVLAQTLGFWAGQLTAIGIEYDLFRQLKEEALLMSWGDREAFWATGDKILGKSIAQLVIYYKLPTRSWAPQVLSEVVLNFIMAVLIAASVDHSNPFSSPSNSAWTIAVGGGFVLIFFGLDDMATWSFRWVTGFNCWILFGIDKRCFPAHESVFEAFAPLIGMPIGFTFYALLIADTRRPAANTFLAQVDAEVSEMAAQASQSQLELLEQRANRKATRRRRRWSSYGLQRKASSEVLPNTGSAFPSEHADQLTSLGRVQEYRLRGPAAIVAPVKRNGGRPRTADSSAPTVTTTVTTTTATAATESAELQPKISFSSESTARGAPSPFQAQMESSSASSATLSSPLYPTIPTSAAPPIPRLHRRQQWAAPSEQIVVQGQALTADYSQQPMPPSAGSFAGQINSTSQANDSSHGGSVPTTPQGASDGLRLETRVQLP
ncbi:hypothetical protein BDZ90DRAFT_68006 [Jaminaea rosea]|uniref:Aquaporin-like protein n=1 Tax=Jaminaea rosea TaxID=1569628 RepID=A0A316UJU7_9BASI|nr:hypothetical protein BDZ90DRAFT_68006 [Jaminaea rosea]PWN25562.1 hypothetical protein BDZ90DRAFT_68006 [Jaminaea rosea]